MRPVDSEQVKKWARDVVKGLMQFNLLKSTDPAKQRALERLVELRLLVQEQLDVLAPEWAEVEREVGESEA